MLIRFDLPAEIENMKDIQAYDRPHAGFPVDIVETEKGTMVYAELPGVSKDDVSITFEKEMLTISGTRKEKEIPGDARILLHEQRVREFKRSFLIAHPVEQHAIDASLRDGLLTVTLPVAEAAKPRKITIA